MGSVFSRFPERLREAIVARLGWTALRPVQEQTAEAVLAGHNALVLAPTAGGKTEAALLPLLAGLMDDPPAPGSVAVLYVAPLKALLNNQEPRLTALTGMVGLRCGMIHGDVTEGRRKALVREPPEVLATTPESLEVILDAERYPAGALFGGLRAVVIDEIHAIAGSDRGAHLLSVLERIAALIGRDVQRLGLSATVGSPGALLGWMSGSSARRRQLVEVPPDADREWALRLDRLEDTAAVAAEAARLAAGGRSFLFCPSRALTEEIAEAMRGRGVEVFVHHGALAAGERHRAEAAFSAERGAPACIVCTSTLELGIDVGALDMVLQVDAPGSVASFLQRLGRTGRRAGQRACMAFLCTSDEAALQALALVRLAKAGEVEPIALTDRCWPVLVQQLLAGVLERGAPTAAELWEVLRRVPSFSGVTKAELAGLFQHLIDAGYLRLIAGQLYMGPQGEAEFGRFNFMELYSVFSSPQYYTVEQHRNPLGSLEASFVERVGEGGAFVLAGRAWQVRGIDHRRRVVQVSPAPAGERPRWGGLAAPQLLGGLVARGMRDALLDAAPLPAWVRPGAAAALNALRDRLRPALEGGGFALEELEGGGPGAAPRTRWWTFAGGAVNQTLRYGLHQLTGWSVQADNLGITLTSAGATPAAVEQALRRLADPARWDDPAVLDGLRAALPGWRLSKFQPALPDALAREVIARAMLDVEGARRALDALPAQAPPPPAAPDADAAAAPEDDLALLDESRLDPGARYTTHLPLVSLAAFAASAPAGEFGAEGIEQLVEVEGWLPIDAPGVRLAPDMFVGRVRGHSMDDGRRGIVDGALAIFRAWPRGTKQHRIVLVRGAFTDPDTGSWAIKQYLGDPRGADGAHREIRLRSLNPARDRYPDIVLTPTDDADLSVVAELVAALPPRAVRLPSPARPGPDPERLRAEREGVAARRAARALERLAAPPTTPAPPPRAAAPQAAPTGRWLLRSVARGGLHAAWPATPDLLPFLRTLNISSDNTSVEVSARTARTGPWQLALPPTIAPLRVTVVGFEDDEEIQALVADLALPGLPWDAPACFRLDGEGDDAELAPPGRPLRPGRWRLLLPPRVLDALPADALLADAAPSPGAPDWRQLDLTLPTDDAATAALLDRLDLATTRAALTLALASPPRARREGLPVFAAGAPPRLRLDASAGAPPDLRPRVLLVAHADAPPLTIEAPPTLPATLALRALPPGLYAVEALDAANAAASDRLIFAIAIAPDDPALPPPPAHGAAHLDADAAPLDLRACPALDLDLAAPLPHRIDLRLPPRWPLDLRWHGLHPHHLPTLHADEEGLLAIGALLPDLLAPHFEALHPQRGDLTLDAAELGRLTLRHTRDPARAAEHALGALRDLWSALGDHLEVDTLRESWLDAAFEAFGCRLLRTPLHPPPGVLALRTLVTLARPTPDAPLRPTPDGLLAVTPADADLTSLDPGSPLAALLALLPQHAQRAIVTDGRAFTTLTPHQRRRQLPRRLDPILRPGADPLELEDLLAFLGI